MKLDQHSRSVFKLNRRTKKTFVLAHWGQKKGEIISVNNITSALIWNIVKILVIYKIMHMCDVAMIAHDVNTGLLVCLCWHGLWETFLFTRTLRLVLNLHTHLNHMSNYKRQMCLCSFSSSGVEGILMSFT